MRRALMLHTNLLTRPNLLRSLYGKSKYREELQHFPQRGPMGWLHGYGGLLAGGALASFAGYYFYSLETVPYTNRRHAIMFVSRSQELAMGRTIFEQTKQQARLSGNLLPDNHPMAQLVKRVGTRVAQVASSPVQSMTRNWGSEASVLKDEGFGDQNHMKEIGWEFAVIRSPVPNAFVVPGGKVVVFTGLIDLLSNEDELAAVLAHESAHVLARHHAERMSTQNGLMIFRFLSDILFGAHLPDAAMTLGVFLPYSRLNEYEADVIGIRSVYD
jgi:predicted Zn-dependent protease